MIQFLSMVGLAGVRRDRRGFPPGQDSYLDRAARSS
jgi:hypothetical protein